MLTMVLGGLWHGASWNFVIWGALHGAALIVHKEWVRLTENFGLTFKRVMAWIAVPLTFYWICITWIFFRATPIIDETTKQVKTGGFTVAKTVLESFVLFDAGGKRTFGISCLWLFIGLALVHYLCSRQVFATWWRRLPEWAYAAALGVGLAIALFFTPTSYRPFIYFQF